MIIEPRLGPKIFPALGRSESFTPIASMQAELPPVAQAKVALDARHQKAKCPALKTESALAHVEIVPPEQYAASASKEYGMAAK